MNTNTAAVIALSCLLFYAIFCMYMQNNHLITILESLNTGTFVSSNEIRQNNCYNPDDPVIINIQRDIPKLRLT